MEKSKKQIADEYEAECKKYGFNIVNEPYSFSTLSNNIPKPEKKDRAIRTLEEFAKLGKK
jgi:hypothetical protein